MHVYDDKLKAGVKSLAGFFSISVVLLNGAGLLRGAATAPLSEQFDRDRGGFAATDAQRSHTAFAATRLQCVDQRDQ